LSGSLIGGGEIGPGARCDGDGHEEVLLQSGVAGRVIGGVGLPAAPDDAGPGAAESAQRAAVVMAALASMGEAVGGPRVPATGAVSEGGERVA